MMIAVKTRTSRLVETMSMYLNLVTGHLVWAFKYLVTDTFFPNRNQFIAFPEVLDHNNSREEEEELRICHYKNSWKHEEAAECAVCLCKIDEGEEIRELRCNHLFHRACLDGWRVAYRQCTCPLCRDSLVPRRRITEFGMEVLVLKFFSHTSSDNDKDTWWLR